jgi:HTH-type transcriptional regulator/antitoxin HigA
LLHGKKEVFVENKLGYDGGREAEEAEANAFASKTLIPLDAADDLENVSNYSDARALAEKLQIHPGIVAGRIQHDRQQYSFGVPGLFVSLRISDDDE